jgi:hypothetical protein
MLISEAFQLNILALDLIIGTYVVELWHSGRNLSVLPNHIHETCVQCNVSGQDVYSAFLHSTCGHMSK